MTAPDQIPSWINKGQKRADWPTWLEEHVDGRPDANGTFLIRTDLGKMRVHAGYMVFLWNGTARTCHASEARQVIAELRAATAPPPPKNNGGGGAPRVSEADVADRRDDTDDISRAIQQQQGIEAKPIAPRAPAPPVATPRAAARVTNPVTVPIKASPALGSMPTIEWVHLDRLLVDDTYQRSVDTGPSRALISRIGRDWDWRLCVPLMVSRRDDGLYVIDGQHRLFGARLRSDIPQLPCCISTYASAADEAAMFVAANRERRAMNRLDDFHAAQAGGDGEAIAIAAIIESVGFSVSRKTGSAAWAPGEVAFTAAIAKVRRKHGDDLARRILAMMAAAFPGQRLVAGSSVFTAAARLTVAPPEGFDPEMLPQALEVFDMPGWASFLQGAKGGDDRAQKLREMLIEAADDVRREQNGKAAA